MAETTTGKRQHESSENESDDEFVGPLPAEAPTEAKPKRKKGGYRNYLSSV